VQAFVDGAITDTATRYADRLGAVPHPDDLVAWTQSHDITQIITAYAPVGPTADALSKLTHAGITLSRQIRPYDTAAWPYATKGFFKFKDAIPQLLPNTP
jgi:deoxyribodipyrimidine photo-lyase